MPFRQINEKYMVPGVQTLMIFGIIALCQPSNLFLHRYGLTIILIGLVGFIIFSHFGPEPEKEGDMMDDALDGPISNRESGSDPTGNRGGHKHG